MQADRLNAILRKVAQKYDGEEVNPLMVQSFYADVSAVIRGLHKSEHFLNVSIDVRKKIILCRDEETLTYLSLLPYLDNRLMGDNECYLIYLIKDNCAYSQCGITFIDLYNHTQNTDIGFDIEVHPMIPLGVYYPDTNEFIEWRKE